MHILRAIEAGGAARPYSVGAEGLNRFLLEGLVGDEVEVIVRGEIDDRLSVGELRPGPRRAVNVFVSSFYSILPQGRATELTQPVLVVCRSQPPQRLSGERPAAPASSLRPVRQLPADR